VPSKKEWVIRVSGDGKQSFLLAAQFEWREA
jgi:hypothetical protein